MATKKAYSLADFARNKPASPQLDALKTPIGVSSWTPPPKPPQVKATSKYDTIVVDLDTIVDLQRVDRHVTSLFEELAGQLQTKSTQYVDLMAADFETMEEEVLAETHKMSLSEDIEMLSAKLKDYPMYFQDAKPLLEKYKELMPDKSKRVVGEDDTGIPIRDYDVFQYVVREFIRIAMKFSPQIKLVMHNISIENCVCGGVPYVVDNTSICPLCQKEIKLKEGTLGNSKGGRSDYYRSETFEEYFDEAQGRRKKPIPPEVYQTITSHCAKYKIDEKTLSKSDVFRILKHYKLSDFYKSINLICHVLLETPLPAIQEYRQRCLERHRLIEQEYMELRESENRSNFLYAWYVLRACLHMEGYEAKREDFITLTTREAALEHNRFMIRICERIREKQKNDSTIKGNWQFDGLR